MKKPFLKFFVLMSFTTLLFVVTATDRMGDGSHTVSREIASKPGTLSYSPEEKAKFETLKGGTGNQANKHGHQHKNHSITHVEIIANTSEPAEKGRPFQLRGVVTALADMTDVKAKWALPENVEVVKGLPEMELGNIKTGESREFEITLVTSTDENRQVHLNVFQIVNGEGVGGIAQYNTILQPKLDSQMPSKSQKPEGSSASNEAEAFASSIQPAGSQKIQIEKPKYVQ